MDASKLINVFFTKLSRLVLILCALNIYFVSGQDYFKLFGENSNADYKKRGEDWPGTCQSGIRQSPIDILLSEVQYSKSAKVHFNCTDIASGRVDLIGSELITRFDGCKATYETTNEFSNWTSAQFHFHSPGEHLINKESYDVEMHLVFSNNDDHKQIMVLGIFFDLDNETDDVSLLSSLNLEGILEAKYKTISNVPLKDFISSTLNDNLYNYQGSLTSPTCDEAVEWMVLKNPIKINQKQLDNFQNLWSKNPNFADGNGNNRIIKPLNRRPIFYLGKESKQSSDTTWYIVGFLSGGLIILAAAGVGVFFCIRKRRQKFYETDSQVSYRRIVNETEA